MITRQNSVVVRTSIQARDRLRALSAQMEIPISELVDLLSHSSRDSIAALFALRDERRAAEWARQPPTAA